jgi:hypothetical protein
MIVTGSTRSGKW